MTETNPWVQEASGDPQILTVAADDRQLGAIIWATAGVIGSGDFLVTQRAAGANNSVDIAAGSCVMTSLLDAASGMYPYRNTSSINFGMPAKPGTSNLYRNDILCLRKWDKKVDSNTNTSAPGPHDTYPVVVSGGTNTNPAALTDPTIPPVGASPAWAGYIPIARIQRSGAESSIQTAAITDIRAQAIGASSVLLYSATPLAQTNTAGPLGVTNVLTIPAVTYDAVHDVTWASLITQGTATDIAVVSLKDGSTAVKGAKSNGVEFTASGAYKVLVPAGTSKSYQLVFTRDSGTSTWSSFADTRYNYIDVSVHPA